MGPTNPLPKLAIHLLSVIANSAGTERNFSNFGNIRTIHRHRLATAKIHKTNVLRMDLRREHAAAGLLTSRGKRKLGVDEEPEDDKQTNCDAERDGPDFEELARSLMDDVANDAQPDTAGRTVPVFGMPLAGPPSSNHRFKIDLANLFNYKSSELTFYWKGGIKNLERETEACEAQFMELSSDTTHPTVTASTD